MANAQDENPRWVVRLTPMPDTDIERLLQMPLGLDVWERKRDPDVLVVAADEGQIRELERRRLANVERLCTVGEFVSRFAHPPRQADMNYRDTKESDEEESQR
jgi:hypothetical protein